jgi:hypothetical protein
MDDPLATFLNTVPAWGGEGQLAPLSALFYETWMIFPSTIGIMVGINWIHPLIADWLI